jgi:hypothetical protein
LSGTLLAWREGQGERARTLSAVTFKGTSDATIFTLLCDAPGELEAEAAAAERQRLSAQIYVDRTSAEDWYPDQLALDAPLRFNILFSIGSTLAFAAVMLLLGTWRLGRIAF